MGLGEDKLFKHMTGFPLIKSGGHLSQLFWNDTASLQRKWIVIDLIVICHPSYMMAMLEGHSVSFPFGLLSLEQVHRDQTLTYSIQNSLFSDPQKD